MDISKLAPAEALEAIAAMDTVEQLREAATSINLKFSGNTGEGTLRSKLEDHFKEDSTELDTSEADALFGAEDPIDTEITPKRQEKKKLEISDLLKMDPNVPGLDPKLIRQIVRAKALRLVRCRISNLDPNDSQLSGAIITVINKYCGKVSKFVPFGEENEAGYHLPQIIVDYLNTQKFALRREIKGGQFGVKRYKTSMINKYSVTELPMLTEKELADLAAKQQASHAIDNS